MVQLRIQSSLIGNISRQWGPSLSDCLEIEATIQKGLAIKGTWKSVSTLEKQINLNISY